MPSGNLEARLSFDQGKDCFSNRDFDLASDHFKTAVTKDPLFAEAIRYLAESYEKLGYTHRAKKAWEQLTRVTNDEKERKEIQERIAAL